MGKQVDYYLVAYTNKDGVQICKPFYDDENGTLTQVALFIVYEK